MTLGPIKILLVESDVGEQAHVERFVRGLGSAYRLHAVSSTQMALKCLTEAHYDVVLVDYRFSDGTVLDLLENPHDVPVIFLAEEGQESTAALALKRGAYDYLIRDSAHNYLVLLPGTIQKVLNRRRAELALQQFEFRCHDLMDLMMDIYMCISEDGSILLVNRAGASQLGYTPREMMGMPLERILFPDDVDLVKRDMVKASGAPDQTCESRFRLRGRNGRILSVKSQIRVQPERGRQIPVVRFLCRVLSVSNGQKWVGSSMDVPHGKTGATDSVPTAQASVMHAPRSADAVARVLVVDANKEQRALAARILAKLGYRVVTAESGAAAVALMRAGVRGDAPNKLPFDVILMDLAMLNGSDDGLGMLRSMLKEFPQQRYVIMSAAPDDERVSEAHRLGIKTLVQKPYAVEELDRAIRSELDRS